MDDGKRESAEANYQKYQQLKTAIIESCAMRYAELQEHAKKHGGYIDENEHVVGLDEEQTRFVETELDDLFARFDNIEAMDGVISAFRCMADRAAKDFPTRKGTI